MSGSDGTFILALRTLYADDRSTVARAAGAIFCEIFSRHHFPVRCVTFYTRTCGRIYIAYSTKQLFSRIVGRDYFYADLIFDWLHQYSKIAFWLTLHSLFIHLLHGKNRFAKISKNLARYKSENNFIGHQNNYGISNIKNNTTTFWHSSIQLECAT